ncbi:MAG: MBL fold metallo-hydrolase [Gammaproteobacteria bacterium]
MNNRLKQLIGAVLCCYALSASLWAQQSEVVIKTEKLTDSIYVLMGQGGNIGLLTGADGVLLVDDDMKPVATALQKVVQEIAAQPVRFVLNTHWHFDHTGGNGPLADAGAIIVAHDNVRARMGKDQYIALFDIEKAASAVNELPIITFSDELSFHITGEDVRVVHIGPGHTDGDAVVIFPKANIIHMGDLFFNGRYPVIDLGVGGSLNGMIASIDKAMPYIKDDTVLIPGHGPVSDVQGLRIFRDMLQTMRQRVTALVAEGKSLDEVIAAAPSSDFDAVWAWQFLPPERWTTLVYKSITQSEGTE